MAKRDELYLKDIIQKNKNEKESKISIETVDNQTVEIDISEISTDSAFIEYRPKADVADNISTALASKFKKQGKFKFDDVSDIITKIESSGALFALSDLNKTTGLLSVCPAVTALMNTCYSMKNKPNKQDFNHKHDEKINYCINYILHKINPEYTPLDESKDADPSSFKNYVFDASPYLTDVDYNFTHSKSYLDTVTWVILALQTARSFALIQDPKQRLNLKELDLTDLVEKTNDKVENTEEEQKRMIKKLEDGIVACVQLTTEMALEKVVDGQIQTQGWSYTGFEYDGIEDENRFNAKKALVEPSLYFSYVATTVYLGLYKDFEKYIVLFREIENNFKNGNLDFIPEEMRPQYWNHWSSIRELKREYEKANEESLTEEQKELFQKMDTVLIEDLSEVDFLMNRINLGQYITNTERLGYLTKIKAQSLDVADIVWNKFKDKIADHFVYPNANIVDEKSIENSGSSNELFNGLFVIGIILNSAYDAQLPEDEYENLIDVLQACVQKTQRYYDSLERRGESYKVNNYILQFIEKDPINEKLGTILRKSSIKVSSLVPILLKMNNLVSEFVIQYPQRQMRNHLISIMKNRMESNDKTSEYNRIWLWEGDEYQSISNYYYIDALNAFYNYYDKYEKRYIKLDDSITEHIKNSIMLRDIVQDDIKKARDQAQKEIDSAKETLTREHIEQVKEKDDQIRDQKEIISNLEEEKEQLAQQANAGRLGREVLELIGTHINNQVSDLIPAMLNELESKILGNDTEITDKFLNIMVKALLNKVLENNPDLISRYYGAAGDATPEQIESAVRSNLAKNFADKTIEPAVVATIQMVAVEAQKKNSEERGE